MEQYHEFASEDGVICEICGKTIEKCVESNKKILQQLQNSEDQAIQSLGQQLKKSKDWGSREAFVLSAKSNRLPHEIRDIQLNFDKDEYKGDDLDYIMQYHFIPPEIYVRSIICSVENTFLLTTDGKVYSWGGITSLLGRRIEQKEQSLLPAQIIDLPPNILQISVGVRHALALDINGRLYSWGNNKYGQLGQGSAKKLNIEQQLPLNIESVNNVVFTQIFAGQNCSFGVSKGGQVYAWGDNQFGQLALETKIVDEPTQILDPLWEKNSEKVIDVSANRAYLLECIIKHYFFYCNYYIVKQNQAFFEKTRKEMLEAEAKQQKGIREMQAKVKKLEEQLKQNLFERKLNLQQNIEEQKKLQAFHNRFQDDPAIKHLIELINNSQTEILDSIALQEKLSTENNDIQIQINDLDAQLKDINKKQQALQIQEDKLELEYYNKPKNDLQFKFVWNSILEQRQANETLRSQVSIQKSKCQDKKSENMEQIDYAVIRCDNAKKQFALFENLKKEKEKIISNLYVEDNKQQLLEMMKQIESIHQKLQEYTITGIVRNSKNYKSIFELEEQSNYKLNKLQKKINKILDCQKNSAQYEFLSKISNIVNENFKLRQQINHYISGIMTQTQNKLEEYYFSKELQEFDINITPNIIDKLKTMIFSNESEQEIQKQHEPNPLCKIIDYFRSQKEIQQSSAGYQPTNYNQLNVQQQNTLIKSNQAKINQIKNSSQLFLQPKLSQHSFYSNSQQNSSNISQQYSQGSRISQNISQSQAQTVSQNNSDETQ